MKMAAVEQAAKAAFLKIIHSHSFSEHRKLKKKKDHNTICVLFNVYSLCSLPAIFKNIPVYGSVILTV